MNFKLIMRKHCVKNILLGVVLCNTYVLTNSTYTMEDRNTCNNNGTSSAFYTNKPVIGDEYIAQQVPAVVVPEDGTNSYWNINTVGKGLNYDETIKDSKLNQYNKDAFMQAKSCMQLQILLNSGLNDSLINTNITLTTSNSETNFLPVSEGNTSTIIFPDCNDNYKNTSLKNNTIKEVMQHGLNNFNINNNTIKYTTSKKYKTEVNNNNSWQDHNNIDIKKKYPENSTLSKLDIKSLIAKNIRKDTKARNIYNNLSNKPKTFIKDSARKNNTECEYINNDKQQLTNILTKRNIRKNDTECPYINNDIKQQPINLSIGKPGTKSITKKNITQLNNIKNELLAKLSGTDSNNCNAIDSNVNITHKKRQFSDNSTGYNSSSPDTKQNISDNCCNNKNITINKEQNLEIQHKQNNTKSKNTNNHNGSSSNNTTVYSSSSDTKQSSSNIDNKQEEINNKTKQSLDSKNSAGNNNGHKRSYRLAIDNSQLNYERLAEQPENNESINNAKNIKITEEINNSTKEINTDKKINKDTKKINTNEEINTNWKISKANYDALSKEYQSNRNYTEIRIMRFIFDVNTDSSYEDMSSFYQLLNQLLQQNYLYRSDLVRRCLLNTIKTLLDTRLNEMKNSEIWCYYNDGIHKQIYNDVYNQMYLQRRVKANFQEFYAERKLTDNNKEYLFTEDNLQNLVNQIDIQDIKEKLKEALLQNGKESETTAEKVISDWKKKLTEQKTKNDKIDTDIHNMIRYFVDELNISSNIINIDQMQKKFENIKLPGCQVTREKEDGKITWKKEIINTIPGHINNIIEIYNRWQYLYDQYQGVYNKL